MLNDNGIIKIIFPCEEGFIRIFDFHKGNLLNKINLNNEGLISICLWNKDFLFVGCKNKLMKLVNIKSGEIVKNLEGHNHWICSIKKINVMNQGKCLF